MKDKYKIFSVLCLMLITVITGCGKESKNEPEVTPTPEVTTTPTPEPTPTPVEDRYVDLTEEEKLLHEYKESYIRYHEGGIRSSNPITCYIIAYYKTIGLDDFLLPVMLDYELSVAEEKFGGSWKEISNDVPVMLIESGEGNLDDTWLVGELTVAQIEEILLYDDTDNKVYIRNDPSVETEFDEPGAASFLLPDYATFKDMMAWLRYWGDADVTVDENGNIIWIDQTFYQYVF